MGRNKKVQKEEVKDLLMDVTYRTVSQIAKSLNVSKPTVRSRCRELRDDGEPVIPVRNGVILYDSENKDHAEMIMETGRWIRNSVVSLYHISKVTKKPMIECMRKLQLSKEERQALKPILAAFTYLITWQEAEEDVQ